MTKKQKKTFSDYYKPFLQVENVDFHYLCKDRKGMVFGLTVWNGTKGTDWEIYISKKGKSVKVFKSK